MTQASTMVNGDGSKERASTFKLFYIKALRLKKYKHNFYLQSQILIDLSTEQEANTFGSFGDH